jgi:hypothetical protein
VVAPRASVDQIVARALVDRSALTQWPRDRQGSSADAWFAPDEVSRLDPPDHLRSWVSTKRLDRDRDLTLDAPGRTHDDSDHLHGDWDRFRDECRHRHGARRLDPSART